MPYSRSESPFFHNGDVQRAIVRLASCDRLVIYCGAGVTIDRTGLSWGDLIAQLFEANDNSRPARDPTQDEVSILRRGLTPLQLASILAERTNEHYPSERAARVSLVPKLQQALYKGAGWQSGALVSNIIRLAFGLVQLGKTVTIVTSNYDTYLEEEYEHYRKEIESSLQNGDIPGLIVEAPGIGRPFRNCKPRGAVGSIEIIYLHGRVPPTGSLGGRLALSENDYHQLSESVVRTLKEHFSSRKTGVLILGASLTDPPLLKALSDTRRKSDTKDRSLMRRIALMPAASTGFVDQDYDIPRLVQLMKARTVHFDVELLIPDFHYQIAQFCQEIFTAVSLQPTPAEYAEPACPARYGCRLQHWWEEWQQQGKCGDPEMVFGCLTERLDRVNELLASDNRVRDSRDELLKIELWVRYDPGKESRRLALWGTSTCVLQNRRVLHFEDLALTASNASLRAFIEGRPQYLGRHDLTEMGSVINSRWQSFLSVPIRIELPEGVLPVGVVTLASMRGKDESGIPEDSVKSMNHIIRQLTALGHELLQI